MVSVSSPLTIPPPNISRYSNKFIKTSENFLCLTFVKDLMQPENKRNPNNSLTELLVVTWSTKHPFSTGHSCCIETSSVRYNLLVRALKFGHYGRIFWDGIDIVTYSFTHDITGEIVHINPFYFRFSVSWPVDGGRTWSTLVCRPQNVKVIVTLQPSLWQYSPRSETQLNKKLIKLL
jgi:hypothetical protein